MKVTSGAFSYQEVLIETYWNVKMVIPGIRQTWLRINRNILECKES